MRLMLSPQMMSLLAAYTAFEVKQGTGQLYRSQEHLGGLSLPPSTLWFCPEWDTGGLASASLLG